MAEVEQYDADDMMPNDGTFINAAHTEDDDQAEAEERAKIVGAQPLLKELFEWIDLQIASADSLQNINLESKVPVDSQIQGMKLYGNQMVQLKTSLQNMATQWGVHYDGEPTKQ